MVREQSENLINIFTRTLLNPHLWGVTVIMVILILIHYEEALISVTFLERLSSILSFGLTRHTFERILFLVPIVYACVALGLGGGIAVLVLAAIAMIPRVLFISLEPREAFFETGGVLFTGILLVSVYYLVQRGRQRLKELEATQKLLSEHIQRLSMLHSLSRIVNETLELDLVLRAAVEKIRQGTDIRAAWIYLNDEKKENFKLAAFSGLPEKQLQNTFKLEEVRPGSTRQISPIEIATISAKQALLVGPSAESTLKNILVVPLTSKGLTLGALVVGTVKEQPFPQDEIDMLIAIGDQLSIAIENARLYEKEHTAAEACRISEKSYRDIFENASDAIWVHDLNGKILSANIALSRLTGYSIEELIGANISLMLPEHGTGKVDRQLHERVLRGENVPNYEQELRRKDGGIVVVQLGTSLTSREGQPFAFQHIARDISEQKRAEENLKLYVQKVSEAQEAERKRISRELHDETAQALVVISRHLDDLARNKSKLSISDVREEVKKVLEGVRHFSQELRPSILDDLGLIPALKWLATDTTNHFGIAVETEITGTPRPMTAQAELMLFRITQEALNNMRKHAEATKALVKLDYMDHIIKLTISDNGKGFQTPARVGDLTRIGKLGLTGMQERAQLLNGMLTIDSAPGKGTSVIVEIPVE